MGNLRKNLIYDQYLERKLHPVIIDFLTKLDNLPLPVGLERSYKNDFIRIQEGWRTPEKQEQYYSQGRNDSLQVLTHSIPYKSFHNWGLAVDLVFTRYGYDTFLWHGEKVSFSDRSTWLATGIPQLWRAMGGTWGGDWSTFPDCAHFEYSIKVPIEDSAAVPFWWNLPLTTSKIEDRDKETNKTNWGPIIALAIAGSLLIIKE